MKRALAFALAIAACGAPPPKPPMTWTTTVRASNPLVGKTYDERARRVISLDRAESSLSGARFVLLGEKHDNADHHRLQAEVLAAMTRARPAVVFEMIDVDLQPAIDAYLATGRATLDGLRAVLQWDTRGWPAFSLYAPIFEIVLRAKLKIVAAGLPHALIRRVVHEGPSALPPDLAARVHLKELPRALGASLDEEIKASHCGMLPDEMIAPMSLAQRVKDALMADLMNANAPAVLIAGNGHVRSDRGVPFDLGDPRAVVFSFVEVEGATDPSAYVAENPASFLVFTPRVDDEDPCAKFK